MMKIARLGIICLFIGLSIAFDVYAQNTLAKSDGVEVISQFKEFYRYKNFYLSGQPTLEALEWLKSQNVTKIINLRTEKESKEYAGYAYDEKAVAEKLGFEYYSLPVHGIKGYTGEKLEKFIGLINKDEKTLVHCRSARRAADFFMAYLIRVEGYSVNEAVKIGRKIVLLFPLEVLLGTEMNMKIEK